MRIRHSLLIWALLLTAPAWLSADEDERAFARRRLFEVASLAVSPDQPDKGGLGDIQLATAKDRTDLDGRPTTTFEAIDQLVGVSATEETPATEGLIQQGSRLYRWVTGKLVDRERGVEIPPEPAPEPKDGDEEKPKDPPKNDTEPPAKGDEEPKDPPKADDAPPKEEKPAPPAKPRFDDSSMPSFIAQLGDRQLALPPQVPPGARDLSDEQRDALVDGELRIQTEAATGSSVITLKGIERLVPYSGKMPDRNRGRYALVSTDELAMPFGVDYLAWRRVQVALRQERWAQERPLGLVTDAEVRSRKGYVDRAQARIDELDTARKAIDTMLQRIDRGEREWTRRSGVLSIDIEKLQAECEDCEESQKADLEAQRDRKMLEDRHAQLELRLLYVTVLRARGRLSAIDEIETLTKEEYRLAEAVYERFRDANNRGRRQRQLAGLRYQELTLDQDIADLRQRAETASDGKKGEFEREADLLASMRALTVDLVQLVELRTTLESRASPARTDEPAPAPTETSDLEDVKPDPLASVRHPSRASIDEGYIQLAREKLSDPKFDANLVAAHYEAADEVAIATRQALQESAGLAERSAQFERDAAALSERMKDHPYLWQRRRELDQMKLTFAETTRSIEANRERVQTRLQAIDAWKAELLDLGLRSFKIRVDRTLSAEQLGDAAVQALSTTREALDWAQLRSTPNAGDFLKDHWPGILAALTVLVASGLGVVYGRKRIDAYLREKARGNRWLRTQLEVREENAQRKEAEAAAEAARREAEAEALTKAAGEETTVDPDHAEKKTPEGESP